MTIIAEQRELEADHWDAHGRITYMAHAKGYVMVRRPRCQPFTMREDDWRALPTQRSAPAGEGA